MYRTMRKINEIFYSLQGEGAHTGTPVVFVRFSGCNLRCPFCDTQHAEGTMMSDEEILKAVGEFPCHTVVLTGGEPGLWIDEALVDALHAQGKRVHIETNGTRVLPANIDWVTCSPKEGGELQVKRVDEVKVVFTGQDVSPFLQIPAKVYFLQPCSGENTEEVIEYILRHPEWRLSLQTHKLLDIR
jgi:organic radical activating enzyme